MKHAKKPTREQRKLIQKNGLHPEDWMVVKATSTDLVLVHRDNDKTTKIISKIMTLVILALIVFSAFQSKEPVDVAVAAEPKQEEVEVKVETDVELVPATVVYYPVPLDQELQTHIIQTCEEYQVDPSIIFAMIDRESDFRADVIGDSGLAFGLMQIHPRWHGARMERLNCTDLLDPKQNVTVGIDYLAELLATGNGIEWALMAYNGGYSYAYNLTGKGIVSDYATEILSNVEILLNGMVVV